MAFDNKVVLRQFRGADGQFKYPIDTSTVQLECLEAYGETFENEYYQ